MAVTIGNDNINSSIVELSIVVVFSDCYCQSLVSVSCDVIVVAMVVVCLCLSPWLRYPWQ